MVPNTQLDYPGDPMRADLMSRIPLICLACRRVDEDGLHIFTVAVERAARTDGDEILEGILRCENPGCGRQYPIIDGIPIMHADAASFLQRELVGFVDPDHDPEALALMIRSGPDDQELARLLETMSIYLDSHWGDASTPRPDGMMQPGSPALLARLAACEATPVATALELGSSVGRGLFELARGAALTVGVDYSFAALTRARRILAGLELTYARRIVGRYYSSARIQAQPTRTIALICADALDPPFPPACFDRVAAINLLDVVPNPEALLDVLRLVTRPGGEILCSSPYAWQSGYVAEAHRLGNTNPAAEVIRRLTAAGCVLLDEAELPWTLRRDARSAVSYRTHFVHLRRENAT